MFTPAHTAVGCAAASVLVQFRAIDVLCAAVRPKDSSGKVSSSLYRSVYGEAIQAETLQDSP